LDTLISNVTVVTMNERLDVLFGAYIGIRDGKLCHISKTAPEEKPAKIIDGTGMVAMPGLINCHTHLATTVLRSFLDDLSPREALEALLLKEAKMDSRIAKAAATIGIAEALRFGITSISDLYYYPQATAQVVAESGMKANLALSAYRFIDENEDFDFEQDEQCQALCRLVDTWHGYDNGRIHIDAGIYAEYTSNYKLWEALGGYAAQKELGFQLHLSQNQSEADSCLDRTGLTPAELLSCHGVFIPGANAAGCGCLSAEDMTLLGKKKVSVIATPTASFRSASPCEDILGCVKAGANVALGTGGAADGCTMDLFQAMADAVGAVRSRGGSLPAPAALMMATVCGARAQNRAQECGMLKEGMDADLILVDFSAPHLIPCHNVLSALVFSARGGDVAMTMVRGNILYQNGQFPTLDLKAAVEELTGYAIPRLFDEPKH